jgi:dienelactone hydrolase
VRICRGLTVLIATILLAHAGGFWADAPGPRLDHSRLMVYWSADGKEHPIKTPDDWRIRRQQVLRGMEEAMGPLPDRTTLPPLDVKVTDRVEKDVFTRLAITYQAEEGNRVPAFLYLPKGRQAGCRVAAMLALHPTSSLGKRVVSGEGAQANRAYALELAQRGYVVLAPDYVTFGEYKWDLKTSKHPSGTMQGIVNHMRGVDLLRSRPEVDPERIGAIGHSLGGHNAMFVGAFDERLKVIVSSCGWTPFHDYYGGKIAGWTSDRYMPRLRDAYGLYPDRVPFDFYEVVAALAPRAFFSNSPVKDDNFAVAGVKKAEPKAREVYALLGAAEQLRIRYPQAGHDFPDEVRREAYEFIDRVLGHKPDGPD